MAYKDPYGAHRNAGIPLVGAAWNDTEFTGDDIAGVIFQDCKLERVRLVDSNLWQTTFVNCRFDDCEFVNCRLFRTQWVQCSGRGFGIKGGEFSEAVWSECRFGQVRVAASGHRVAMGASTVGRLAFDDEGCAQFGLTVSDCTFEELLAEQARWESATMTSADFRPWSITGAVMQQCLFVQTTARELDLSSVRFERCNLFKSDFSAARISHAPGCIFAEANCADTDFGGAELTGALFAKVSAPGARFVDAKLDNAMFPDAVLHGADFSRAIAKQSVWNAADLTKAKFSSVNATGSIFRHCIFDDTDLQGATLVDADLHGVEADLVGADTRGARGSIDWRAEREAEARRPPET